MPIAHAFGLLVFVGGLILIIAFAKRLKNAPPRPSVEAEDVTAMNALLARMEDRIIVLERILDADDSGWRKRL